MEPSDATMTGGLLVIVGFAIFLLWADRNFAAQQKADRLPRAAHLEAIRARAADWEASVTACAVQHREALLRTLRRTLSHDPYGNLVLDRFEKEVEYFFFNVVVFEAVPRTDDERHIALNLLQNWALEHLKTETLVPERDLVRPDGIDYERQIGQVLAAAGYGVRYTPTSGDQGVDVIAERGSHRIAIQCKFYSSSVGNDAVQQVYAGAQFHETSLAVVVAPVGYTRSALDLARTLGVHCLHHDDLVEHLAKIIPEPIRTAPISRAS